MAESSSFTKLVGTIRVGDAELQGEVLETAPGLAVVEFGPGEAREVPVGSKVDLLIEAPGVDVAVEARVALSRRRPEGERVRLELSEAASEAVREALRSVRSVRIGIRGQKRAERVRLATLDDGVEIESALLDISAKGLGVVVRPPDEGKMAKAQAGVRPEDAWVLQVCLRLPGNERDLRLIGVVRYRMWTRGSVKYGIELDGERTAQAFPDERQTVAEHLIGYQQALLQRGALREAG